MVAFALVACGGSKSPAQGPASSEGGDASGEGSESGDLRAKFQREAGAIDKHVVRVDGAFNAYIEAKASPVVEKNEQGVTITADLGWESPVQCFVYDHVIDAGAAANLVLRAAAKDVKFKAMGAYFLVHQALDPILGIRGVYHVERGGTVLAGDFKLMVMPRSLHPVLCFHDAPGYAESFARVTADFAKSFEHKNDEPKPLRGELWVVNLDGTPVGYSRETTYAMEDGNVRHISLGARFVPTGPGEMSFDDKAEVITTKKDGTLTTGRYIETENGESSLTIDVQRSKVGYDYVGTIQNKEVRGSFKSKQPLQGGYGLEKRLKSLARAPKKTKFEQWEYVPTVDALGPSKVSYEVTPAGDGLTIMSTFGQRGMTMKTNAHGVIRQTEMAVGARKVQIDLVEEVGEL